MISGMIGTESFWKRSAQQGLGCMLQITDKDGPR